MNIVIGSGPCGVTVAHALLKRGEQVTLIDPGVTLEPERQALKERLASTSPEQWLPEDVEKFTAGTSVSTKGAVVKAHCGSDYVYRTPGSARSLKRQNANLTRSFAQGGFSNVWGASLLPYAPTEFGDWPVSFADLTPHYRNVLGFVPQTASDDGLSEFLPFFPATSDVLPESAQVKSLHMRLLAHEASLKKKGFVFGGSRLAVKHHASQPEDACRFCTLCLYGCPYDLIYSAVQTLETLKRNTRLMHISGVTIDTISETGAAVLIQGKHVADASSFTLNGSRVFLAAGALESTRILMESLSIFDEPLRMKHSDFFMLPFLRAKRTPGCMEERGHRLSQIFAEIIDTQLASKSIHLQFYGYNDYYEKALKNLLGVLYPVLKPLVKQFLERFFMIFGYLHSDESSSMQLTLQNRAAPQLLVEGFAGEQSARIVRGVVKKLLGSTASFGGIPLIPRLGTPGNGSHSGGSFPMSKNPSRFEVDLLGRPHGFQHVHVVDSTVFPSLPAATITFTAMANADRIVSQVSS